MALQAQSLNVKQQPRLRQSRNDRSELTEQITSLEIVHPKRRATASLLPQDVIHLQRSIGNQAVGKLLKSFQHNYQPSAKISNHLGASLIQLSPEDDIRQELHYRFHPNDFAKISARKERIKQIFLSLNQADTQHFYDRLSVRRDKQDALAKLFYGSLAHATCEELLGILREKLRANNQRSGETQNTPIQIKDDKEPLDPTHDWRSDPQYIDKVKQGKYDFLSNKFTVIHNDGTSIELDYSEIHRNLAPSSGRTAVMPVYWRKVSTGKIYPNVYNNFTTPNIVWLVQDIERQIATAMGATVELLKKLPIVVSIGGASRARTGRGVPRVGGLSSVAQRTLQALSGKDRILMQEAMELAATKGGGFMNDVAALANIIGKRIPNGKVHLLGSIEGSQVFGSQITGTGLASIKGVTTVVVMQAGKLVRVVGPFR